MAKQTEKNVEKKVVAATKKVEMVEIFVTSYHLWRKHLKTLLAGKGAKFQKNEADYNGFISVAKASEESVKKILTDFKTKNPETEYWW